MLHLGWLLLLVACQDYTIFNRDKDANGVDPEDSGGGDVTIDADCPALSGLTSVDYNEACSSEVVVGSLESRIEWGLSVFDDFPESNQIVVPPVVGQLTDDNGDGRINASDMPDIVVVTDDALQDGNNFGVVRVISGDGDRQMPGIQQLIGEDLQAFPYRFSSVALGDVDLDGLPDLIYVGNVVFAPPDTAPPPPADTAPPSGGGGESGGGPEREIRPFLPGHAYADEEGPPPCYVIAASPDETLLWAATDASFDCAGHAPALADLEGDGTVEIIVGALILNGEDGTVQAQGTAGEGRNPAFPMVGALSFGADLDGDGTQEVVTGNTLYNPDGSIQCQVDASYNDGFPAVADFDGDGAGEFISVGDGWLRRFDAQCHLLMEVPLAGSGNGGPPTIADFDADGTPEIGVAESATYTVYEADGTVRWSNPVVDASSHSTGSAVYDFDGDGQAEVVYADEATFWIFDGATGAVRLADPRHTSRTLHEFPTIADVDGDGRVEVVVPNGGGYGDAQATGLFVLGAANDDWLGNRQVWNQHAYAITNINDDLSVPAHPLSNWPTYNTFRSGDLNPVLGGAAADAVPLADVCMDDCVDGRVLVGIRVGNEGGSDLRDHLPVSLYSRVGDRLFYLQTVSTEGVVAPGHTSDTLTVALSPVDLPDGVLVIRVDDQEGAEQVRECVEDNNEKVLEGVYCRAE